ncbi:MAG: nitrilase family protein [Phocaeicola sp.]|nr:nitrilase family protein [Phocaeicola sp.]
MKIALIQSDIEREDITTNLSTATQTLQNLREKGVELVVFPEMFTTGCTIEPQNVAEGMEGRTVQWFKEQASLCNFAIVGSVPIVENGYYYNRMLFVTPEGNIHTYNKRHLFSYGNEHLSYTAGNERTIVNYKNIRFLLQICYDLRFPVYSRNLGDYDAAIYIAAWPEGRINVWDKLIQARAIENQCYVLAVNRVGKDKWGTYTGHTAIVDFYGNPVGECTESMPGVIIYELTLDKLQRFREKFPVLADADHFSIY